MSTYVIIGASSGIGRQLATNLVAAKHRVYGTYNKHPGSSSDELLSLHSLDVLGDDFHLEFLPDVIDGLVYCPGSINLRPFNRLKAEDFVNDFRLQVAGAIKMIQALLTKLRGGQNPSILLFSTVAVQTGMPFHSQVAASKGAIEGLTLALAAEFAPLIRVNCIAPSLTDTSLAEALLNTPEKRTASALRHPLKRTGVPDDIANLAEFLLSGKAGWITGQIMHVDGGMSTLKVS